jgi:drug/metabolite transporter (DMT)-like permease
MTTAQRPMNAQEWALLILLSLLWGGSFLFVGVAVRELPPLVIVAARVTIAATLLWMFGPFLGLRPARLAEQAGPLLWLGLINNVAPFLLIAWGQTRLASGVASILNASTPIMTVIAAHALTQSEKLTSARLGGAAVGLIGVAAMVGPDALGRSGDALAELAILGASTSYAFASIYARRFRAAGLQPIEIATGQITAATLVLAPLALFFDRQVIFAGASLSVVGAVVALASVSTAFAYIVYFRILAGAGAVNVVLVTLLVPASSLAFGALALGERPPGRAFLGLALIALGLSVIDGRLWRKLRKG